MAAAQGGRDKVMTGDLPEDFLRFNSQPGQAPGMVPVMYQPNAFMPVQTVPTGRLSITVVQAKLAKNYGLTRMDPYCRITIGNHVFETPTDSNGAANPRWNKLMTCPLPRGVTTLYVEIFDERSFSMDERIAWGLVQIKDDVLQGETLDDWYSLSGKQGEEKEGMINLVFAHREAPAVQPMMYQQPMPVMMVPQAMVPAVPIAYPPQQYPQGGQPLPQQYHQGGQPPPQQYHQGGQPPPQQYHQGGRPPTQPLPPPQPSQQDIQNLKDMFPNMEESVIKSVLEASGNNVEYATTYLLTMTNEDQGNPPVNLT